MESGITLITTTGLRPEAFDLCQMYVLRQTSTEPMQWIVVDDGIPEQTIHTEAFAARQIEVNVVRPRPAWTPQMRNTQARNLQAAIPLIRYDKIFFIEDDDWYHPGYLDYLAPLLKDDIWIVGECPAVYYHVERQLLERHNFAHAALCETGIRSDLIPLLERVVTVNDFIDVRLWQCTPAQHRKLVPRKYSVGMKGLPGRPGLGLGHQLGRPGMVQDEDWKLLKSYVGDDYLHYKAIHYA